MSAFKRPLAFVVTLAIVGASGLLVNAQLQQAVGTWSDGGHVTSRTGSAAVTLPDGRTLVVAGTNADGSATSEVLVYDPTSGSIAVVGNLTVARSEHAAVLLKDGRVLVAGGLVNGQASADIELFDPATGTSTIAATMLEARSGLAAARLADKSVLIVGGSSHDDVVLSSTERFDPETGAVTPDGALVVARREASATTLHDGRVVVAGGSDGTTELRSAEIYTPYAGTFTILESELSSPRRGHIAMLLPYNGTLMIAGGIANDAPQSSVDLYPPVEFPDPYSYSTSQFSTAVSMAAARAHGLAGAAALEGHVFVSGGGSTAAETYRFPTVRTDKDDYAPGQRAVITGTGWQAGEVVTLRFQEDPAVHDDYLLTVTADEEGRIFWDQWAPEEHDLGVRFYLIARGEVSGRVAQTTFTDGQPIIDGVTNSLISPDQPSSAGVLDSTVITAKNQGGGDLTGFEVRIRNSSGVLVRTFLIGALGQTQTSTVLWNGRDQSNAVLPDGQYVVRAFANEFAPGENTAANDTEIVTIDNTNPTVVLGSPSDGAVIGSGSVNFVVTPLDAGGNASNIQHVEFYVDGVLVETDTNGNNGWQTSRSVAAGPHTWFVRVFDKAGNNTQSETRSFTFGADSTPPIITPNVSGTLGNNGWYTSNVKITWTVTDPQSAITTQTGCDETSVTTDTAGTTFTCTATSVGGTASQSVTIKRDATAPNAPNAVRTPAATAAGWNNTSVTVTFEAAGDNGPSGIASCSGPSVFTTETPGTTASGTCTDMAGNEGPAGSVIVRIDMTAPVITGSRTPAANSFGWNNTAVTVSFTCADQGTVISGVATDDVAGTTVTTETSGLSVTNTGSCVDNAGNAASSSTVSDIRIDLTKPVITGARSPLANPAGWNNTDVVVSFTCSDQGGVQSGTTTNTVAGATVSTEGAGQSVTSTGDCVDAAGNAAVAASVGDINIDKTKPVITGERSPEANGFGWNNTDVTVSFTCADSGSVSSGLANNNVAGTIVTNETNGLSVTNTGSCVDAAGNAADSSTVSDIRIDKTAPAAPAGARSPEANEAGWNNQSPVTVSFTSQGDLGPVQSDIDECTASENVTGETLGTPIVGTCRDRAGNVSAETTIVVKIDLTKPVITGQRSPLANAFGWNNTDVTVSFTCIDPGPVSSNLATNDVGGTTVSSEGENQSVTNSGSCVDVAGNSATAVTVGNINIDKTAPTISGNLDKDPAASGWFNIATGAPKAQFTCSDSLSGIATGPCPFETAPLGEGAAQSVSHTVTDKAGNSASASLTGINVDLTAPAITITSPTNGSYVLNAVALAAYSCTDSLSGLASCSGPVANGSAFNTASVGAKTFAVSASDVAGNSGSAQVGYTVVYATGLCLGSPSRQILEPVNADGSSVFKQKSTVPSKFRVCDANGVSIGTPGVVAGFALTAVYAQNAELPINEAIVSTTPDTAFRWSASDQQWIFNLSTKNLTAGRTYTYTVYLNDGTQFSYGFTLK